MTEKAGDARGKPRILKKSKTRGFLCYPARRIDHNADGVTNRHDLDLYMAAYDEYTRRR